jgi:hypothetical protein
MLLERHDAIRHFFSASARARLCHAPTPPMPAGAIKILMSFSTMIARSPICARELMFVAVDLAPDALLPPAAPDAER